MASVYRKSSCTISTHAAYDDNEGFLHVRQRRGQSVSRLVTASELSQRGWVFQERILSRRLLHFTAEGLFLEDASGFLKPDGSTPAMELHNPWRDNKINLEDSHHDPCGWYRLIERFTACRLTFETDRLPAVLGLSKCLGEQLDDGHYLWGLWSRSIHQGLLWMNVDQSSKKLVHGQDSANGMAPSWSWGRWTGRVWFPDHLSNCEAHCTLINFETGTSTISYGGVLPAQGYPPHIKLNLRIINLEDIKIVRKHAPAHFMGGEFYHSIADKGLDWVSVDGEKNVDVEFAQLTLAVVAHHHDVEKYQDDDSAMERDTWAHYFLLLSPSENDMFSYRRVGMGASSWQCARPSGTPTSEPEFSYRIRDLLGQAKLRTIAFY